MPAPAIDTSLFTSLIVASFKDSSELPTPAQVEARVDELLVGPFRSLQPLRTALIDEVLRRLQTRMGAARVLENNEGHEDWLEGIDRSEWRHWPRLQEYLESIRRFPKAVMAELNRSTDYVLGRLESPARPPRWDRRGLVLGHVQSGKTTHYASLTAKALDAGYEVVIILAGIHNSLRSQTHERVDQLVIGRDSARFIESARQGQLAGIRYVGVGERDLLLGRDGPPNVITLTSSAEEGDFNRTVAKQIGMDLGGGTRLVLVVKKNVTILENLIAWLKATDASGQSRRHTVPTLVLDDEADHASINTNKDPDADPRRINGLVRLLLGLFDRVGYVGYTATPFANIFIPTDVDHAVYGKDLFPEHFILSLEAPDDYIGPGVVFGQPGDESVGVPERKPLPMFVDVTDADDWMPLKHKKTFVPGPLPSSLRKAIRLFVAACAVRCTRGEIDVHNSMLIHVTRFVDVQSHVHHLVGQEIDALTQLVTSASPATKAAVERELETLWQHEYVSHHHAFVERFGSRGLGLPAWSQVWGYVPDVLARLKTFKVNGQATDALMYSKEPKGLYAIAVGGDKLSRGLTLEGLSVSYFLRTSRMYDTLMQMGRWFGYRPGYVDLCRVYTPAGLKSAFREISFAMEELRNDLNYMADAKRRPIDFGLRVRNPSDGMLITSPDRMRRGEKVPVKFAGELVQTLDIPRSGDQADRNCQAVEALVSRLGAFDQTIRGKPVSHRVWRGVPVDEVLMFLSEYEAFHTPCFYDRCAGLRKYIRQQVGYSELKDWTVAVVGRKEGWMGREWRSLGFPLIHRHASEETTETRFITQAVVGSEDEAIDLNQSEYDAATALTRGRAGDESIANPSRLIVRECRPGNRGLLLLYPIADPTHAERCIPAIAVSFPKTLKGGSVDYTVNEVWMRQHGVLDDWSEDD